ncbi:hypothetical protein DFJ74DRAFT_41436 [Hyaloraphidium curvatum]|nr:hypothetical protein DFJ74DRAFT_41436 [Hyaloraphidium curvatum]
MGRIVVTKPLARAAHTPQTLTCLFHDSLSLGYAGLVPRTSGDWQVRVNGCIWAGKAVASGERGAREPMHPEDVHLTLCLQRKLLFSLSLWWLRWNLTLADAESLRPWKLSVNVPISIGRDRHRRDRRFDPSFALRACMKAREMRRAASAEHAAAARAGWCRDIGLKRNVSARKELVSEHRVIGGLNEDSQSSKPLSGNLEIMATSQYPCSQSDNREHNDSKHYDSLTLTVDGRARGHAGLGSPIELESTPNAGPPDRARATPRQK